MSNEKTFTMTLLTVDNETYARVVDLQLFITDMKTVFPEPDGKAVLNIILDRLQLIQNRPAKKPSFLERIFG